YPLMATSIALENFCSGMGNAAYLAFMMSLCDRRYTATQFALISSLMAQSRVWGGAPTGYLVSFFGWEKFFLLCTLMAAPGLLLLSRYPKWKREGALAA
ncbi:MAG: AmpG family muropeptide MFS transporter, partial [Bdellovibrionota bacterium]